MAQSLDVYARQTLFLIKDSPQTRQLIFPKNWQSTTVYSIAELLQKLLNAQTHGQRAILLLSDEDFLETYDALKHHGPMERTFRYGLFVVSDDGADFLKQKGHISDLLDVISEKELRKATEFFLLRAVRLLHRAEERANQRVGQKTLEHLNQIFIALSAERNPNKLLSTIVLKAMELAQAEGGTLYMLSETDGELYFRARISSLSSTEVNFQQMNAKVLETSLCGYVALTGKTLNVADVASLRPLTLPQFLKSVDHQSENGIVSLLTIPFRNSRNEIISILQLANKRREGDADNNFGKGFDAEDESLIASFATQAAICLENVDLYGDIRKLFEGFVTAAISAIESRDPSTGGHSERVAKMCVALARATTECNSGIYRSVKFREEEVRELEYAALLHDFGKIGVREEVLVKAKKLYPYQLEGIKDRINICKAAARIDFLEKKLRGENVTAIEKEFGQRMREIEAHWQIIQASNEPTVLKRESIETLERIRREKLLLPDGSYVGVLTEDEYQALSVTKGSLTDSERLEIESHVRHTYQFLKMIPWTKDFKHLTEIAYCHHEKLDGSGYPRGLSSHEIPLQSKIMTIADIYDALTAADRWYKEAVPSQKALEILHQEVAAGKLDPVLFEIFVEKRVYELTLPKEVTQVA